MSDMYLVTGYYNAEAYAIWRRQNPNSEDRGPQEGDLAIQIKGTRTVAEMDLATMRARPDIGKCHMSRLSA